MDIENLNLTDHQKMVLLVIKTSSSPATAYNDMISKPKAMKAVDVLSSYAVVEKNDSARTLVLTDRAEPLMINEKLVSETGDVTDYGKELLNSFVSENFSLIKNLNSELSLQRKIQLQEEVHLHLNSGKKLFDNYYRSQSRMFTEFINEARQMFLQGKLQNLSPEDVELLNTDIGFFDYYNTKLVPLDMPMLEAKGEYQGRTVELNKPMRSKKHKKFKVYVRNPKTGNVNLVRFGAEDGGGDLAVKLDDPEARKNFAARHKCEQRDDKLTASYWSCRLPRYADQLGLSGQGNHWW